MDSIVSYALEVAVTLAICLGLVRYLNPYLKKILVDLCATEERAQFWTVFSNILLVGLPMIFAIAYKPEAIGEKELFFEITQQLSSNLGGFLVAMVSTGLMISFFALFAPKTTKGETK